MTIATIPREAKCAANFSIDAAVSPQSGAATTAVLSSTGPLFALPMAALWLGERVTRRIVLGTVLSIAGIVLVV